MSISVKMVMMEQKKLWCDGEKKKSTKTVVTDYSYDCVCMRVYITYKILLQCCDPQFRLSDP